jgi:phospholipid/cholesterol/gamma-HCH transport system substrate-binding protein
MQIKNGVRIYDDAIASIKTEGLIGEKYVDIDAGGGGELLKPGGMINETVSPVDIGGPDRQVCIRISGEKVESEGVRHD